MSRVAGQSIAVHTAELNILSVDAVAATATKVRVTITGRVDYIFAKAIPGMPQSKEVTAVAEADALQILST